MGPASPAAAAPPGAAETAHNVAAAITAMRPRIDRPFISPPHFRMPGHRCRAGSWGPPYGAQPRAPTALARAGGRGSTVSNRFVVADPSPVVGSIPLSVLARAAEARGRRRAAKRTDH